MDSGNQKLVLRKHYVVLNNQVVTEGQKPVAGSVVAASAKSQRPQSYVAPSDSDVRWASEDRALAADVRVSRRGRA